MIKNILYWITITACMCGLLILGFLVGVTYKNYKHIDTFEASSEQSSESYIKTEDMTKNDNFECVQAFTFSEIPHIDLFGVDTLKSETATPTSIRFICDEGTFIVYKAFCVVDSDGYIVSEYSSVAQFIDIHGNKTTIDEDSFNDVVIVPNNEQFNLGDRTFLAHNGLYILYNGNYYRINKIESVDYRYWED